MQPCLPPMLLLVGDTLVGGDFAGNEADYPTKVCAPAIETAATTWRPVNFPRW